MSSARSVRKPPARIGLALAGGGPVGAVHEVAALCALQDGLAGIDFAALDVYVGVSAGAFVASLLANGITPQQLRRILVEADSAEHPIDPNVFLSPAVDELAQRAAMLPGVLLEAVQRCLHGPWASRLELLAGLGRLLPSGLFSGDKLARFLEQAFAAEGRSNDFRRLRTKLRLVATDLDSGEAVVFGSPGHDDVPISRAVQASSALPGLYPPVRINGRDHVDGVLRKTMHASVALREGARLLFCINPIVPFDAQLAARRGHPWRGRLVNGGLPTVLSQAFRTLIHSRMQVGMAGYPGTYRGARVLLFEPPRDDPHLLFTNVFNEATRRRVFEQTYRWTLRDLAARRRELTPWLAPYGISIRATRRPAAAAPNGPAGMDVAQRLGGTLDRLERWIGPR
ncbi:patatin-like phospholipase family protein [Azohydromonas caseinilytica]|uniref:Patatin family protein n=1 Tax=Azohydromonas caseinilytica TaxID=2728836 RepID=A0A848FCU0_9BURK|nr:patatin-like phospholipase family protein [Azohydromonas caseinilytica]NML17122.1 patatin family protein [Azohydromonas caseinilytica]